MYKGLAKSKNYPFMPFVLEGVYNQKGMMQEDGIHPTAKGAAQVARNVFKYLEPLLSK
jgi:acyl-CoA thioesterase-1